MIAGRLADAFGLTAFLAAPVLCYIWIAGYGFWGRRSHAPSLDAPILGGV